MLGRGGESGRRPDNKVKVEQMGDGGKGEEGKGKGRIGKNNK